MDLVVDLSRRGDRTTAVYRALLDAIRGGRLVPGERLPPTPAFDFRGCRPCGQPSRATWPPVAA